MRKIDPELLDIKLQVYILQILENDDASYVDAGSIPLPPDISMDKMSHNFHHLKISGYIEEPQYIGSNILESGRFRIRITPKGRNFLACHR